MMLWKQHILHVLFIFIHFINFPCSGRHGALNESRYGTSLNATLTITCIVRKVNKRVKIWNISIKKYMLSGFIDFQWLYLI